MELAFSNMRYAQMCPARLGPSLAPHNATTQLLPIAASLTTDEAAHEPNDGEEETDDKADPGRAAAAHEGARLLHDGLAVRAHRIPPAVCEGRERVTGFARHRFTTHPASGATR